MKIRLTQDVMEADRFGAKSLKTTIRAGKPTIAWVAGTVVETSDATGAKFIGRGVAEEFKEEIPAEAVEE